MISTLNPSEISVKKLNALEDSKLYQTQRFSNKGDNHPYSGESSIIDNPNILNNISSNLINFNTNALNLSGSNTFRIHSHR